MGKANTNSKAAEKKRERLEMEKKMNARVAIVKAANSSSDPLENLPSFKVTKMICCHVSDNSNRNILILRNDMHLYIFFFYL